MDNEVRRFKEHLKEKNFKAAYLIFGEERFLAEYYAKSLIEMFGDSPLDSDAFTEAASAREIIDSADTLPFMSEKRLVTVRGSGLFAAGRKDDSEAVLEYLNSPNESSVLLFVETDVDKRGRLYKKIADSGYAAEFKTPQTDEMSSWVINIFKKNNKAISRQTAFTLLRTVSADMNSVKAEAEKLCAYAGERAEITDKDIEAVCSPSLETRVFDLLNAMGSGQTEKAARLYKNMLLMKEQPIAILTMVIRQFRLVLQCKLAHERKWGVSQISKELELRSFIVEECIHQGRKYSAETLVAALEECMETDLRIKTGLIEAETGVELLVIRHSLP